MSRGKCLVMIEDAVDEIHCGEIDGLDSETGDIRILPQKREGAGRWKRSMRLKMTMFHFHKPNEPR